MDRDVFIFAMNPILTPFNKMIPVFLHFGKINDKCVSCDPEMSFIGNMPITLDQPKLF